MKSKKMSQEIEQLITLLQEMNKKLKPKSRLEELTEEIKKRPGLKHLFVDDPQNNYPCSKYEIYSKFNHLQKCVILTSNNKFLEEYIDIYLSEHPETINHKNEKGQTALMIAAINSNYISTERTVEILLNHGADINLQENNGCTALMYAARYSRTDSSEKTVKLLLNSGANVNLQQKNGFTALMFAAINSHTVSSEKTVELLLDHGTDVNLQNNAGQNVLQMITMSDKKGIAKLIIEKMDNCDILIDNKKLIKYLWDNNVSDDIIELVIQKGANKFDIIDERLRKFLQS